MKTKIVFFSLRNHERELKSVERKSGDVSQTFFEEKGTSKTSVVLFLIPKIKGRNATVVISKQRHEEKGSQRDEKRDVSGFLKNGDQNQKSNLLSTILLKDFISHDFQLSKFVARFYAILHGRLVLVAPRRPSEKEVKEDNCVSAQGTI